MGKTITTSVSDGNVHGCCPAAPIHNRCETPYSHSLNHLTTSYSFHGTGSPSRFLATSSFRSSSTHTNTNPTLSFRYSIISSPHAQSHTMPAIIRAFWLFVMCALSIAIAEVMAQSCSNGGQGYTSCNNIQCTRGTANNICPNSGAGTSFMLDDSFSTRSEATDVLIPCSCPPTIHSLPSSS